MINVLFLAATPRGKDGDASEYPVCLSEFSGVSLLERIYQNTQSLSEAKYSFAFSRRDIETFHLDQVATLLTDDALIIPIPDDTEGSACTALLAACRLPQSSALLIVSANELVNIKLSDVISSFTSRNLDAGTIIFKSLHPRYSYVRLSDDGLVVEAAQRNPITNNATAGIFWFRETKSFVDAAKSTIRKRASTHGAFYLAPTFNELILQNLSVGTFEIDVADYHPLKTKQQKHYFESGGRNEA